MAAAAAAGCAVSVAAFPARQASSVSGWLTALKGHAWLMWLPAGRAFIGNVSPTSGKLEEVCFAEICACCLVPAFTALQAFLAFAALDVASFFAAFGAEAAALHVACTLVFWLLALAVLAALCSTTLRHVQPWHLEA